MEEQILDHKHNDFRKFSHHIGFSFPTPVVIAAAFFGLIGFIVILVYPIAGLMVVGFFGYICSSTYGFEMDWPKNRCREYTRVFGIKRGEWVPLSDRPYVSVLHDEVGNSVASLSNRITSYTETKYNVYLLSETHRTRMLVKMFDKKDTASEYARHLAVGAQLQFAVYSPQVSARTRQRR
jgi:hypothetical protein